MRIDIKLAVVLIILVSVFSLLTFFGISRKMIIIGGVGMGLGDDLKLMMVVEDMEIQMEEIISFNLHLANLGEKNLTQWMGLPIFDLYIYDTDGKLLTRWSDGRAFIEIVQHFELSSGAEYSERIEWEIRVVNPDTLKPLPLKPGKYKISGIWLGEPKIETSMIDLRVIRRYRILS